MRRLLLALALCWASAAYAGDTTYQPVQVAQFIPMPGMTTAQTVTLPNFCVDNFSGTVDTHLNAHTMNTPASNWTTLVDDTSNFLALDGSGNVYETGNGSTYERYECPGTPNSADEHITVGIAPTSGTADIDMVVLCRIVDADDLYEASRQNFGSGNIITISKRVSGPTDTVLASVTDPSPSTTAVFTFSCTGTGTVNFTFAAPSIGVNLTASDSTSPYNSAGHIGLAGFSNRNTPITAYANPLNAH